MPNTFQMVKQDHTYDGHDSGSSDARLVEEARNGSQGAFRELVQRYERRLWRVLLRFVHDPDLAEDLVQDTFLRVYERLDMFDPARRFGPWLFQIGVNLSLDYLRKKKRRGWWPLFSDRRQEQQFDPPSGDPREQLDLKQEVDAVLQLIPEKYRTVLCLRDLENFSTSEIAVILNRREATIRWRLAEARKRFQELWTAREAMQSGLAPSKTKHAQKFTSEEAIVDETNGND
ncbi:MAG: sigma-70 family RNA polymerase sigma factor [Planctomycetota bacterium]|nr:sigma-70 family RNA polymerase sigma factor [Planctomycetota bacterium]MDA1212363.1 sigma-70 family RNA polymerase sigma factor [Planctomycetota bacterium]